MYTYTHASSVYLSTQYTRARVCVCERECKNCVSTGPMTVAQVFLIMHIIFEIIRIVNYIIPGPTAAAVVAIPPVPEHRPSVLYT